MKTKKHPIAPTKHRSLTKKFLLHPLAILLWLSAGVVIVMSTFQSFAVSLNINATVPSSPLTQAARITSHHDQQHVLSQIISITGECPPNSYVKLYKNNIFSGVCECIDNAFIIQTSLNPQANILQAKVYNFSDNEGPSSSPITLYYDTPATPLVSTYSTAPLYTPLIAPLTIIYDYHHQIRFEGESWSWDLGISGGTPPYSTTVDWGDGDKLTLGPDNTTSFTINHTFKKGGYYRPIVQVTDREGNMTTLQLFAQVNSQTHSSSPTALDDIWDYLWLIWPAYVIILLMIVSFLLGKYGVVRRLRQARRK